MKQRNERIWYLSRSGMTYREIGARFGISAGRVRQIVDRCRRRDHRHLLMAEGRIRRWVILHAWVATELAL